MSASGHREAPAWAARLPRARRDGEDPITIDDRPSRLTPGGDFLFDDANIDESPLWGRGSEVLWSPGESLIVCGPAGVGKTTLACQLVAGLLGVGPTDVLGFPLNGRAQRLLYIAGDRPRQFRRAMRRNVGPDAWTHLNAAMRVWPGPPADVGKHPGELVGLCRWAEADVVVIDSLKDIALRLADDEVGAAVNNAFQRCLVDGIEVLALHHQRKGQDGRAPKTLEDVYGSTWITAGAGSVLLLWGDAGSPLVELRHLKQPADEIGPLTLKHDHHAGTTTVHRGAVDVLRVLRSAANGLSALELARIMFDRDKPTDAQRLKADRKLQALVGSERAHRREPVLGGIGGTQSARYFAVVGDAGAPTGAPTLASQTVGTDEAPMPRQDPHNDATSSTDASTDATDAARAPTESPPLVGGDAGPTDASALVDALPAGRRNDARGAEVVDVVPTRTDSEGAQ